MRKLTTSETASLGRPPLAELAHRLRRYGADAVVDGLVGASGFLLADLLRFGSHAQCLNLAISFIILVVLFGPTNYRFGLHRRMWRYGSLDDVLALAASVTVTTLVFSVIDILIDPQSRLYWLSTVPNGAVLSFLMLLILKLWPRLRAARRAEREDSGPVPQQELTRVLIVGAGETGSLLSRDFQMYHSARVRVVGFIDDDPAKVHLRLNGAEVLGSRQDLQRVVAETGTTLIAIALSNLGRQNLDDLVSICQETRARVQIVSSLSELATQLHPALHLRELEISDLLGREEVRMDVEVCARYIKDKVVLITGAAGSIGSELAHQLLQLGPERLILLDVNETGLFDLHASLRSYGATSELVICLADITDEQRMTNVFSRYRPQVVFHAAAYKHVPMLQDHPGEAVKANVLGTAILCRAAHLHEVERFVFISSDKAVAAANNLGYSKRIGELLVRAYGEESSTIYCAVRFGNVVGSRGSVVPTFEKQIADGGPITVTDPGVTRFFMSIPEAACLVIQAAANASSGSIFMLDMGQPIPIVKLAEQMIRLRGLRVGSDIEIVFTGLRPGEKMHEELTSDLEQTLPTGHPKIMQVVDPRTVLRPAMERMVRLLVAMTQTNDVERMTTGLRIAATQGTLALFDEAMSPTSSSALTTATTHVAGYGTPNHTLFFGHEAQELPRSAELQEFGKVIGESEWRARREKRGDKTVADHDPFAQE